MLSNFLNVCNLKNLGIQKTCSKNPENSSYIELILTSSSCSFQNIAQCEKCPNEILIDGRNRQTLMKAFIIL